MKNSNTINQINVNGSEITDAKTIANEFNNFFVNIATNLSTPVTVSDFNHIKEFVNDKIPEQSFFHIPYITEYQTRKLLTNLDISKATGLDQLGPRLLKLSTDIITKTITRIINLSIKNGVFPDTWKYAKVTPLFKSGSPAEINNYRPISILPTLSKIIERHVHDSFILYLNSYKLLCESQSGFRKHHSCETALVHMIDKWLKAMNEGNYVGCVMLDFRKAFDIINIPILCKKLELYKCGSTALKWFESYLTNRKQILSLNGQNSDNLNTKSGVPQGSILGPLLFLLFINDLPLCLKHTVTNTDMYADDTTVFDIGRSKDDIQHNLQIALNILQSWCENNGMVLNPSKTKVLLITTSQKRSRIRTSLSLKYDNILLDVTTGDKILGVFINQNLKWDMHITFLRNKIAKNLWLLSRIKSNIPLDYRIIFYKAYVQPHLDYCNVIWGNTTKSNLNSLILLQKRACRIILGDRYTTFSESIQKINSLTINQRIILQKAKFMYRVSQKKIPSYIQDLFQYNTYLSKNLRSSNSLNFIIPKPNIELFKESVSYSGTVLWNSIPADIRASETIKQFSTKCEKWLLNNQLTNLY